MTNSSKIMLAPSILSSDFGNLAAEIKAVENAGADLIHVDVMDGVFVPNITIGQGIVKAAKRATELPLDVHLMIVNPDAHLKTFAEAGADIITVHAEAAVHLHRTLQTIKSLGKKAGVSFNPATPLEAIEPVLDLLDMVLIMSVNPGFGGQKFITSSIRRIELVKNLIDKSAFNIDIEVDGGITKETSPLVKNAGANILVAGSAVYNTDDYEKAIREIRNA
ncbi:MAG: ribulose-phosphate 3-epimerase [Deltaproteobacteria bacterium]|nr:ribulose-phosphate 3-epimerase [Deltaproteobacteria bacterium]